MNTKSVQKIIEELVAQANFSLREDVIRLLKKAYTSEKNKRAKKALRWIIDNARIAKKESLAICQDTGLPVLFIEAGKNVKMSTRKADFVTLDELTYLVGKDVVRYFFIMRGMNTHLNFDIELAQDQSDKNPVFYLQYAHARISNIIRHGEQQGITFSKDYDSTLLEHESEIKLIKQLSRFPEEMASVLESLEPRVIANYLQTLATSFHKFYGDCKVVSENIKLSQARMALVIATKNILAEGLKILGINAPDRM